MRPRPHRLAIAAKTFRVIVAVALTLLAVLAAIQWTNWVVFKPMVQRYVWAHAQRQIEFDGLHLGLTHDLMPMVRFDQLTISNAPWAAATSTSSTPPLIDAGEIQFVFAWQTVTGMLMPKSTQPHTFVNRLVLRDAKIDLERRADGHRNWRLSDPNDIGPGKVRVLRLDAQRSRLRFVHQGVGLDVTAHTEPLRTLRTSKAAPSNDQLPADHRIVFEGTRRGIAFDGDVDVGAVLSFYDTGEPFALRGEARSGSVRLKVDGQVADLASLDSADAHVQLTGTRLSDLAFFWQGAEPLTHTSTAYVAEGHWHSTSNRMTITDLRASLGDAINLEGGLSYWRANADRARPKLKADLHSRMIDVEALRKLAFRKAQETSVNVASLKRIDGDLHWTVDRLHLPRLGEVTQLQVKASLNDGRFGLNTLQGHIDNGTFSSEAHLNSTQETSGPSATLALSLALQHINLQQLAPLPDADRWTGWLDAQVNLQAHGVTMMQWRASANGQARMHVRDGSINDRLEAKLALSGGAWLRSVFTPHQQVPMKCAALELTVHDGIANATRLGFITDHLSLSGRGTLDLRDEVLDVLLTPQRQQAALFVLDRSITVRGPLTKPHIALVDHVTLPASQACEAASRITTASTAK